RQAELRPAPLLPRRLRPTHQAARGADGRAGASAQGHAPLQRRKDRLPGPYQGLVAVPPLPLLGPGLRRAAPAGRRGVRPLRRESVRRPRAAHGSELPASSSAPPVSSPPICSVAENGSSAP